MWKITEKIKKKEIMAKIDAFNTIEEKASYLYKPFYKNIVSKAEVAQELSFILEEKYSDDNGELKKKLPQYIVDAIKYATLGD